VIGIALEETHANQQVIDNQAPTTTNPISPLQKLHWQAIAESAYCAYAASTNNKNFLGQEMPAFNDLPEAIKSAWMEAVQDVAISLVSLYDTVLSSVSD
jgi:hypothetical protein